MKRAKDLTGPSIRDALAATKAYPGVTGNITLDENRNPLKPAVVLKLQDGKYIYQETIKPDTGGASASAATTKAPTQ